MTSLASIKRYITLHPRLCRFGRQLRFHFRGNRLCLAPGDNFHAPYADCQNLYVFTQGKENSVTVGENTWLFNCRILLKGDRLRLSIGSNCTLRNIVLELTDQDASLAIGDTTTMMGGSISCSEPGTRVCIGKDCMFGPGLDIRAGDGHAVIDLTSGHKINPARDIMIGEHVWMGLGVSVLKGVRVGEQAVIATRSVLTKDIPPRSMAAGVPARVVRTGVTWSRSRYPSNTKDNQTL